MRYIIKAESKPVGALKHFTSVVVYFIYCILTRISSFYVFLTRAFDKILRAQREVPYTSSSYVRVRKVYKVSSELKQTMFFLNRNKSQE